MRGLQFVVGDLMNYGVDAYGEMASQIIDAADWDEGTVGVYQWLAKSVPENADGWIDSRNGVGAPCGRGATRRA
jgi:hypothetical protein